MTKHDLLAALAEAGAADATELAHALGVPYATSAMALLRLVRQGLAGRQLDPQRGTYTYWVTDHGQARLAFFEGAPPPQQRGREAPVWRSRPSRGKGAAEMTRKTFHTGTYHCPTCFIEFDVVAEQRVKCDACGGPLADGSLNEVWADHEDPNDEEDKER